jgi:hypothetical protein
MLASFILAFILPFVVFSLEFNIVDYGCSVCRATMDDFLLAKNEKESPVALISCAKFFTPETCSAINFPDNEVLSFLSNKKNSGFDICRKIELCPKEELSTSNADSNQLDFRVSKALSSKGYNKVRVSVISNNSSLESSLFSYTNQFQYRWTDKYLSTGIATLNPGEINHIQLPGQVIDVYLPAVDEGVRGVIIADPCFQSNWIVCAYQNKFNMLNHSIELLNAINSHEDVHYWQILGDNFYDQSGEYSSEWFNLLSQQSKQKIFHTVPGNHDFWVNASPKLYVPKDQLGNGFMQFYGQDTLASTETATAKENIPYDFSQNPDALFDDITKRGGILPSASNFFFYNRVGNVGFIGFAGAYSFETMSSYFTEACDAMLNDSEAGSLQAVLLLGHWNEDGDGCDETASVPAVYSELLAIPSCATLQSKLRYFMGHAHCNLIIEKDVGFMVGAQGMNDKNCEAEYGIPVVDTTQGAFQVYYFLVNRGDEVDNYQSLLDCFQQKGVSNCYSLAEKWADIPFDNIVH